MAKGSVRKKGKKWYYRFYVEDASGNLVQKEFAGTESKSETEKMLRKAMEDYDAKKFLAKADNLTLGQMLDVWAEEDLKTGSLRSICRSLWIYLHLAVRKEILSQRVTPSTISVLSTQSCNSPSDLQSFQSSTSHSIQCSMW